MAVIQRNIFQSWSLKAIFLRKLFVGSEDSQQGCDIFNEMSAASEFNDSELLPSVSINPEMCDFSHISSENISIPFDKY